MAQNLVNREKFKIHTFIRTLSRNELSSDATKSRSEERAGWEEAARAGAANERPLSAQNRNKNWTNWSILNSIYSELITYFISGIQIYF